MMREDVGEGSALDRKAEFGGVPDARLSIRNVAGPIPERSNQLENDKEKSQTRALEMKDHIDCPEDCPDVHQESYVDLIS